LDRLPFEKTAKKVFANTRPVSSRSAPNSTGHTKQDDSMFLDGFEVMFCVISPSFSELFPYFERKNVKHRGTLGKEVPILEKDKNIFFLLGFKNKRTVLS